ncbi:type IX secretion system membrane protein PorP/SprF [bacterium]|nr:type IX secretion system membrane protein PorP/SprF [bacterium]
MKKTLTTFLVLSTLFSFAQQEPYYTHFRFNQSSYNPAAAGNHLHLGGYKNQGQYLCINGVTHYQWRQFDDVTVERGTDGIPETSVDNIAPETHNINLETMFNLGKAGNQFLGAGLSIIDDNVGFTQRLSILADINYKMALPDGNSVVSGGIGIGFQQFGLKNANYKYRDPNDPLIPQGTGNEGKLNLNAGLYYQMFRLGPFEDFFAGISVTQLNGANYMVTLDQTGTFNRKFVPHYYALFGADYPLGNITLEPAILFKYAFLGAQYTPQFDVTCTGLFAETFRGGLGYRQWGNADALSLLLGYKKNFLELGYSYDITVSTVSTVSAGTHEIMVRYCLPFTVEYPPKIPRKGVREM